MRKREWAEKGYDLDCKQLAKELFVYVPKKITSQISEREEKGHLDRIEALASVVAREDVGLTTRWLTEAVTGRELQRRTNRGDKA